MKKYIFGWVCVFPFYGWSNSLDEKIVQVTPELCQQYMIEAIPDEDVAYQAENVENQDIIPADIHSVPAIQVPSGVKIKITKNLSHLEQNKNQKNLVANEGDLGTIEAHTDGRLYYNGQPLFDEDVMRIKKACQALMQKK